MVRNSYLGKRKRSYGRKRLYRRKPLMTMTRSVRPRIPTFTVKRTVYLLNWTPSTVATINFWQYFTASLNQITNVAEYTALFDSYRINWFKYTFRPRYTDVDQANATKSETQVHVLVDPKSSVNPSGTYTSATLNSYFENGRVKSFSGTKPFDILVKYPCIPQDINATSNSMYQRAPFISTAAPSIIHRGVHIFMADGNLSGSFGQQFDIYMTMSITFKGQK